MVKCVGDTFLSSEENVKSEFQPGKMFLSRSDHGSQMQNDSPCYRKNHHPSVVVHDFMLLYFLFTSLMYLCIRVCWGYLVRFWYQVDIRGVWKAGMLKVSDSNRGRFAEARLATSSQKGGGEVPGHSHLKVLINTLNSVFQALPPPQTD